MSETLINLSGLFMEGILDDDKGHLVPIKSPKDVDLDVTASIIRDNGYPFEYNSWSKRKRKAIVKLAPYTKDIINLAFEWVNPPLNTEAIDEAIQKWIRSTVGPKYVDIITTPEGVLALLNDELLEGSGLDHNTRENVSPNSDEYLINELVSFYSGYHRSWFDNSSLYNESTCCTPLVFAQRYAWVTGNGASYEARLKEKYGITLPPAPSYTGTPRVIKDGDDSFLWDEDGVFLGSNGYRSTLYDFSRLKELITDSEDAEKLIKYIQNNTEDLGYVLDIVSVLLKYSNNYSRIRTEIMRLKEVYC